MNDFRKVFSVISSHCTEQNSFVLKNGLERIAKDARIPIDELDAYLSIMHDFGFVRYSRSGQSICLTSSGNKNERACETA
jgi:hypothetical protein